ncbi:alpha/beta hydrolase [Amycolatopsis palatopharyngis]|uniref:alpha/beta hydrolase n=1 Tax=Amycolatopsis palatopharyngis TaxID=187982 RepID=UPI000E233CE5|nr:alpha/beta hydrolase [Amycolatopsis palatopharyngis]
MVSYSELKKFERGLLDDCAEAWQDHAENLRDQADNVKTQIDALDGWEGEGGDAARDGLRDLRGLIEDSAGEIDTIPPKITDAAETIQAAKEDLQAALDGKAAYLDVDGSGGVSISPDAAVNDFPAGSQGADMAETAQEELQTAIDDALRKATRADEDAAGDIRGIVPSSIGIDSGAAGGAPAAIPGPGSSPETVAAWWNELSPLEKETYLFSDSVRLGNLDGLPIEVRDRANRFALDEHESILQIQREHGNAEQSAIAEDKLEGVDKITTFLDRDFGDGERAYLIGFDAETLDKDGRAIVSVGNPDTADNVATHVPGTGAGLGGIGTDLDRIEALDGAADGLAPDENNATVLWLGYDAPDEVLPDAGSTSYADAAEDDLSRFQEGLRVTHSGPDSHNVVMGHSYGSAVVGHAVNENGPGMPVDDVVFIGSPGVGADGVDGVQDLSIDPEHVWATKSENDAISLSPNIGEDFVPGVGHGTDPTNPNWGLDEDNIFYSERGPGGDSSAAAHSAYWDDGRESLENLGRITVDQQPTTGPGN